MVSVKCVLKVCPRTQVDLLLDLGGVSSVSFDLKVCPQVGVSCCFSVSSDTSRIIDRFLRYVLEMCSQ